MAKEYVRYTAASVLFDPESGAPIVPPRDEVFEVDHPLVKRYRWAFHSDAELAEARAAERDVSSVTVETASTRGPGGKRSIRS